MFPFTLPLALSSFVGDCNRSTAAAACVCCSSVNISVEFNAAHIFLFPPFDLETMQNLPPPPLPPPKQRSFSCYSTGLRARASCRRMAPPPLSFPPTAPPPSFLSIFSFLAFEDTPPPPPPPPPLLSLTHQLVFLPCFHRAVRPTLTGPTPDRPNPGAPCPSL